MQQAAALTETGLIDTRDWEELLCTGAREVFEMMINVPLERCPDGEPHQAGEFTAVIGLAGPINGVFAIRCNENTAVGIASGMLGIDEHEARAEMWDALGEVCNMVIGNFKAKTGKAGERSVLSVPTVIHGHDYRVRPLINGSVVECRMQSTDGVLHLRLDYRVAK
jgi:CheY-specific phosphatase CheX